MVNSVDEAGADLGHAPEIPPPERLPDVCIFVAAPCRFMEAGEGNCSLREDIEVQNSKGVGVPEQQSVSSSAAADEVPPKLTINHDLK